MSIFDKYCNQKYCYDAKVVSIYDGDTVRCDIDLGFGIIMRKQKIRLFGVNTPEIRGESKQEGYKVRDYVREEILEKDIELFTIKDKTGKYGRLLGVIKYGDKCLNQDLLDKKMAIKFLI